MNDEVYIDEVGGVHSPCDCYNPRGTYCGECGKLSCADCGFKDAIRIKAYFILTESTMEYFNWIDAYNAAEQYLMHNMEIATNQGIYDKLYDDLADLRAFREYWGEYPEVVTVYGNYVRFAVDCDDFWEIVGNHDGDEDFWKTEVTYEED